MSDRARGRAALHLKIGWWSLFAFAALGFTLEALHGFKVRVYLDAGNDTRRLMWTLAHAHGALAGVLHIIYGLVLGSGAGGSPDQVTSRCLVAGGFLLPAGFFAGGIVVYGGDPGAGILLVPAGAALLLWALARIARRAGGVVDEVGVAAPRRRG